MHNTEYKNPAKLAWLKKIGYNQQMSLTMLTVSALTGQLWDDEKMSSLEDDFYESYMTPLEMLFVFLKKQRICLKLTNVSDMWYERLIKTNK